MSSMSAVTVMLYYQTFCVSLYYSHYLYFVKKDKFMLVVLMGSTYETLLYTYLIYQQLGKMYSVSPYGSSSDLVFIFLERAFSS
jgi:hypothetical protein